jgi:predicted phage terminase large subunit-like protein
VPAFQEWLEIVSPRWRWRWPHLTLLRESLNRVTAGELHRLIVTMPPRHGKSEHTTVRYPVWRLEQKPALQVIIAAHTERLARRFSRKALRLATNRIRLADDRTAAEDWETAAGGGVRAVGVGSGVVGEGADLVLIDDPIRSREEADSEALRDRVADWFLDDIFTRLEPGGAIIVIATRWHEDDLPGRLLQSAQEGGEPWECLNLPALAEEGDPLGRREGEALCPERFSEKDLLRIRKVLGRSFHALYQGTPVPREGELLKVGLIQHARPDPASLTVYQAWDLAISRQGDFCACATIGTDGEANAYLLHVYRGRLPFRQQIQKMGELAAAWNPVCIGIETNGYQNAAFQEAASSFVLPFIELHAGRDKVARAQLLASRIDAGKFFGDRRAPWWSGFETEALSFPAGKYDDQIDAAVYALLLASQSAFCMPTCGGVVGQHGPLRNPFQ